MSRMGPVVAVHHRGCWRSGPRRGHPVIRVTSLMAEAAIPPVEFRWNR